MNMHIRVQWKPINTVTNGKKNGCITVWQGQISLLKGGNDKYIIRSIDTS